MSMNSLVVRPTGQIQFAGRSRSTGTGDRIEHHNTALPNVSIKTGSWEIFSSSLIDINLSPVHGPFRLCTHYNRLEELDALGDTFRCTHHQVLVFDA